jgi:FixJ family two-component response regulator
MQQKPAQQDAPPVVGVIDPDPVARNGLSTLLHGFGIDVSTFDSAESFLSCCGACAARAMTCP